MHVSLSEPISIQKQLFQNKLPSLESKNVKATNTNKSKIVVNKTNQKLLITPLDNYYDTFNQINPPK